MDKKNPVLKRTNSVIAIVTKAHKRFVRWATSIQLPNYGPNLILSSHLRMRLQVASHPQDCLLMRKKTAPLCSQSFYNSLRSTSLVCSYSCRPCESTVEMVHCTDTHVTSFCSRHQTACTDGTLHRHTCHLFLFTSSDSIIILVKQSAIQTFDWQIWASHKLRITLDRY
jgi:hypothetical protein